MHIEKTRSWELHPHLIHAYARTFIPRRDCYPIQLEDGSYISVKEPLRFKHLTDHFYGRLTLGTYALFPDNQARWLCLDADDDQEWAALLHLAEALHAQMVVLTDPQHISLYFHPHTLAQTALGDHLLNTG